MSVTSFYRVQCSGPCGRWLVVRRPLLSFKNNATEFRTWGEADEAAARAGWHDGSQGQHAPESRRDHPWLVPLCPACRVQT